VAKQQTNNYLMSNKASKGRDLHRHATHYYRVPGFEPIEHWVLPPAVTLKPVTGGAARDVPALVGYDFVIVEGMLLIVNPTDRAIAEVIGPRQDLIEEGH
jgi:hypothetical protein